MARPVAAWSPTGGDDVIGATATESREYVAARRVLLDALEALHPHLDAMILAGAQAVYLRTGPASLPIAEFTTDGDLTIDPSLLTEAPPLVDLMKAADFDLALKEGVREPGIWEKKVVVEDTDITVPVDLIVPTGVAPPGGRRGARLSGHGKAAARKIEGLEASLIDNEVMSVRSLEPDDRRRVEIRVAGVAALLVAKAHKIADRVEKENDDRLKDKDAADVVRLMQGSSPDVVAITLRELRADPAAGASTGSGLDRLQGLFGSRGGAGIAMATRSLRKAVPRERVRAICMAWVRELNAQLDDGEPSP